MQGFFQQLKIDYRIRVGYLSAFVLLFISYLLTWYANKQLAEQSQWVMKTDAIISHLDILISDMKDAETGTRGFMITKDKGFLDPYYDGIKNADSTYHLLSREISDSSQLTRLTETKGLIERREGILKKYLDTPDLPNDSVVAISYRGKKIMDSLRFKIAMMKLYEQEFLDTRNKELQTRYSTMNSVITVSLILAILFLIFGFITYARENNARMKADEKVSEYQNQLRNRIQELDIANKQLVEMKRAEQFATTGRIARTIAHEVRNPLTNIELATSQLSQEIPAKDENMDMLFEMISRNSKRINQLITELLNATRFVDLSYKAASINQLVDEALELSKDRIELNKIIVQKNYGNNIPPISVDPEKIKIAFLNLIVNAIEAMKPDGNKILKIVTRLDQNKCILEISDNGVGIDAATVEKLFEPFFTTKSKGNGLGLTNTQNIILNHDATINVESKIGRGTTFIIKFNIQQKAIPQG